MKHLKYFIALQDFFRERMDNVHYGDTMSDGVQIFFYDDDDKAYLYVIPRTIDDSSEEAQRRSLWGMIEGDKRLWSVGGRYYLAVNVSLDYYHETKGATPTEAILKALCTQEGIEVG